eukprot:GHVU01037331.1.p1 GENE.GHVU01037331.1~~GHVU01037331.1.p1  ORF type:complete len:176 (-),score=36.99 GHVU01037331.1:146-628(-)
MDKGAGTFKGNVAYINNDIIPQIQGKDFAEKLKLPVRRPGLSQSFEMGPCQLAGIVRMVQRHMCMPISTTVYARVNWVRKAMGETLNVLRGSLEEMNKWVVKKKGEESKCAPLTEEIKSITRKIEELSVVLDERKKELDQHKVTISELQGSSREAERHER